MKCYYCKAGDTKVTDKRDTKNGITRRRRQCLKCSKRFTTFERVDTLDLYVVKKDRRREVFDREKLLGGIMRACEKRPISKSKIEKIVDEIEDRLKRARKTEVKSSRVGEMAISRLRKLDKVAYIRFASVYKEFADVSSFEVELKELSAKKGE